MATLETDFMSADATKRDNPAPLFLWLALAGLVVSGAAGASAAPLRIENQLYAVTVDPASGTFAVQSKLSGQTFSTGKLRAGSGAGKLLPVSDRNFGDGQAIEVTGPEGSKDLVALYPSPSFDNRPQNTGDCKLPFVAFHSTLRNAQSKPVVLNRVPLLSATVELGKPLSELRALGSGGLTEPAKNPGSYAFLAVADPISRRGVVGGWLTHERASGVVFSPVEMDKLSLEARLDYGSLLLQPNSSAETETFLLGYFDDARAGLEIFADAMAKQYAVKLRPKLPGYCTWYMEKFSGASDEAHLAELSAYAATNLGPYGFGFIQIDDHWQLGAKGNGPKKNFTAHDPKGPYPHGMKPTAEMIGKLGLMPGIWFMPFAGKWDDPFFQEHQDWFVKTREGKPYDTAWGGTCLDMTHPGAREYVRGMVSRIAHDWGYQLFKMDGFWTGSAAKQIYVNDGYKEDGMGDAVFANPAKPNIEAMRDGVKLVRQAAGPEVFLLGCCLSQNMRSLSGSLGLLDAMRVGPDTGSSAIGYPHATRFWFLNGRVWWNDPDCVSVRAKVPLEQARLNATFAAIADTVFYNSDWMPDLPADRLDILRRCIPGHNLPARPVDVLKTNNARIWQVTDTRGSVRRDVITFFNYQNSAQRIVDDTGDLALPNAAKFVGFDFWNNQFVPPFSPPLSAYLPARSCRVLAIRPVSATPQLLSTSRHITQGIVDVANEQWDAAAQTLSGSSQVVGGDPYELRIVVPADQRSWKITGVQVSADDRAAEVKASFQQDGPRIRATLQSPASRNIKWTAAFVPGAVSSDAPKPVTKLTAQVDYQQISLRWEDQGAVLYRVSRGERILAETSSPSFADRDFPRDQKLIYQVAALGWNGQSAESVSVEATPIKAIAPPPTPPLPDVELGSLKYKIVKNGWGKAQLNLNVKGNPLSLGKKTYAKGIGTHAPGQINCPIPSGAKRFVALVGIDDGKRASTNAKFVAEIYGDVQEMGEPPVLLARSPELSLATFQDWSFNVELDTRFKELRLVLDACGENKDDWADWVNAGFVLK